MAPFSKVKEARDALKERAKELLDKFIKNADDAHLSGDHESAYLSYKFLIERIRDDDDTTIVGPTVDRPQQIQAPKGPQIQIGVVLGGTGQLPPAPTVEVIDVTEKKPKEIASPDLRPEPAGTGNPEGSQN